MKVREIYLIPTYLSESNGPGFVADDVKNEIPGITHFAVENIRSARRYLSSLNLGLSIESLHFYTLDKTSTYQDCAQIILDIQNEKMGVISESGLPGIADPGSMMVKYAHDHNINVIPLTGSTSIILALISSGFNGQQFTFHGYLPIDKSERKKRILSLEKDCMKSSYTQVFMETPYRNQSLFESLLSTLDGGSHLYVGFDITGESSFCKTLSVADWKKKPIKLEKKPTIFAIGQ